MRLWATEMTTKDGTRLQRTQLWRLFLFETVQRRLCSLLIAQWGTDLDSVSFCPSVPFEQHSRFGDVKPTACSDCLEIWWTPPCHWLRSRLVDRRYIDLKEKSKEQEVFHEMSLKWKPSVGKVPEPQWKCGKWTWWKCKLINSDRAQK